MANGEKSNEPPVPQTGAAGVFYRFFVGLCRISFISGLLLLSWNQFDTIVFGKANFSWLPSCFPQSVLSCIFLSGICLVVGLISPIFLFLRLLWFPGYVFWGQANPGEKSGIRKTRLYKTYKFLGHCLFCFMIVVLKPIGVILYFLWNGSENDRAGGAADNQDKSETSRIEGEAGKKPQGLLKPISFSILVVDQKGCPKGDVPIMVSYLFLFDHGKTDARGLIRFEKHVLFNSVLLNSVSIDNKLQDERILVEDGSSLTYTVS